MIVYDPNNSSVAEWRNISIVLTDTATPVHIGSLIAASEGEYTVWAQGTGCPWILRAIWRFICRWLRHVIPEYPFGTIAAMVAFLGATCLMVAKKNRFWLRGVH